MAILRRTSNVICIVACTLAVQACDLIREPLAVTLTEDQATVMSVLTAGDSIARVLLMIVPAASDPFNPFGEPNWVPIADADVRLVAGADTIRLTARPDAAANACLAGPVHEASPAGALLRGCYVGAVPGGIQSGATYVLIADLPGHGRLEGRTTVPTALDMLQPSAGAEIETSTHGTPLTPALVQWTGASGTVELRVSSRDDACTVYLVSAPGFLQLWLTVTDATSAEISVHLGCTTGAVETSGDIILTAFDDTYAGYVSRLGENRDRSEASAGFTGPAIGVFGSAATVKRAVQFVRN
jgi:hypothetical protein